MLLKVTNLRVSYGKIKALHGVDFQIDEGEIVTIIGATLSGNIPYTHSSLTATARCSSFDFGEAQQRIFLLRCWVVLGSFSFLKVVWAFEKTSYCNTLLD